VQNFSAVEHPSSSSRMPRGSGLIRSLAVCILLGGIACGDPPPKRPTTLDRYPRAMDRLARLMRAEFSSPDPVAVEQAIRCEIVRLQRVLGDDFSVRQRLLVDSLHQEFAAEQFNQLGQRLAAAPTPSGDAPACKAINEEAEREVPLANAAPPARTDSVASRRPAPGDSVR
jgi:hypothetical protein